jgi:hypothetical protein
VAKTLFEAIGYRLGQKAAQAKNAFALMGGTEEESLRAEIRLGRDLAVAMLERIYDHTYTVNATGPTLLNFNYLGVDEVTFVSFGGVNHGFPTGGNGAQLVLDNLSIDIIPEPSCYALFVLMAGLSGFAWSQKTPSDTTLPVTLARRVIQKHQQPG